MYKVKRIAKKYWILFSIFFIMNIFFIGIITNIINIHEGLKVQQSLITNNAKILLCYGTTNITKDKLINIIKSERTILQAPLMINTNEKKSEVKGLYYNYDIGKTLPLIEGRMFTVEELEGKEKVVLVGENLKNEIVDDIIKIQGEDYKVVGILGGKKGKALKDSLYINLNSKDFSIDTKPITIDIDDEQPEKKINEISEKLKENKMTEILLLEPGEKLKPLEISMAENENYLIMGALISCVLITTIINISLFWIDKEKSIIGVKGLVGGTKSEISFKFWLEYELVIATSLITTCILWILIGNNDLNLKSLGILTIINIIASTLSIIIPIIKLNRLNINSIIKENI